MTVKRRRQGRPHTDPHMERTKPRRGDQVNRSRQWKASGPGPCQCRRRGAEVGGEPAVRAGSGIGIPAPHNSDRETASNRAESRSTLSGMAPSRSRPARSCRITNIPPISFKPFWRSCRIKARQKTKTLFCISIFPRNLNRNDSRSEFARKGTFDFALQALDTPGVPRVVLRVYVTVYYQSRFGGQPPAESLSKPLPKARQVCG
jgi:hypothetical protein